MGPSFMSFAELYEHVTQVCGTAEAAQKDILLRLERGDLVAFGTKTLKDPSNRHFPIAKDYWDITQIAWDKPDEPIRFRKSHWPPEMGSEVIGVYVERKDALRLWPRSINVIDALGMFFSSPRDEHSPPVDSSPLTEENATAVAGTPTAYVSPYILMMLDAVRHFGISPSGGPKKQELVAYFRKQRLPDGSSISDNLAKTMATLCRPPEAMRGGNKRVI
jgi:hypothetical protein